MGQKYKSQPRCAISNKIVNGKEVVLTDYAIDYVKKIGYVVIRKNFILNKSIMAILFVMMLSFLFLIPTTSATEIITCSNNTFNLWKFNEGMGNYTLDTCYSNVGYIINPIWVNGKYDKAIEYDGIGTYTLTNGFTQNLTEFSFSVWITHYPNIYGWETIFQRGNYYTNEFVELIYLTGDNQLLFMGTTIVNPNITDGNFHNIIGTYNGSDNGNVSIYIDGIFKGTANSTILQIEATTQPLYIGVNYANGFIYNGTIDELVLYDKVLTFSEINQINAKPVIVEKTKLLEFNFSRTIDIIILVVILIIAGILFFTKNYALSGGLIAIIGLMLLFSSVNMLLSIILVCIGIGIIFKTT